MGYILHTRGYTIWVALWQGSLEVNTALVLTCLVLFHTDGFHWNDHNPSIFVLKGTKLSKLNSLVQVQYNKPLPLTLLTLVLQRNIGHRLFLKDLRKKFSSMALRLGKKLLFAFIGELICCNDSYKMIERQLISFWCFK